LAGWLLQASPANILDFSGTTDVFECEKVNTFLDTVPVPFHFEQSRSPAQDAPNDCPMKFKKVISHPYSSRRHE
jgi:hypothetical protein